MEFADLDDDDREAFEAFSDAFGNESIESFKERYMGKWESEKDFAEHIIDECYNLDDMMGHLASYFDYEAYARDLFIDDYYFTYTYKRPWPAKQVRVLLFSKMNCLRDINGLGNLLFRFGLWHRDGQNAVLYLGRNLVADHIVWQCVVLLVVRIAELTAQVVTVTVLMLVFLFVLNGDGEVALVIDAYAAIFFLDAWSSKFHDVTLVVLLDIDCGCCTVGTRHPIIVKEILKYCWHPTVLKHYW